MECKYIIKEAVTKYVNNDKLFMGNRVLDYIEDNVQINITQCVYDSISLTIGSVIKMASREVIE